MGVLLGPIYRPTAGPEDWKAFLAKPDLHWKTGSSAKSVAYAWEESGGLPQEIKAALEAKFGAAAQPLIVIPEYKVPMPGSDAGASQNDVFMLCRVGEETAVVMVEGKVNESFDETIAKWLGPTPSEGKKHRLQELCKLLGIDQVTCSSLRYQLFHRCASAIFEADRFGATHAVMLVHSFSQEHRWFEDYQAFTQAIGVRSKIGTISTAGAGSRPLHVGWVTGDAAYLAR